MPRLCRPIHAAILGTCTALALVAGGPPPATAQNLLRPELDDARNPQRFSRPQDKARPARPTFGNPPASGAARTGFDSTSRPRKPDIRRIARPDRPLPAQAPLAAARAQAVVAAQSPVTGAFVPVVVPRRRPPPDLEPFEPVGVRAGAFLLKPALEVTGGYDSNPARTRNGTGSRLAVVAPELSVQSLWSRHALRGELRSSYTSYDATPKFDRPYLETRLLGRVDVSRQTRIELEGRYLLSTDNPGSPNLQADLARLPIFQRAGASAGVAHQFNRFEVALRGGVERTTYAPSELTDGTTASNDERNYNQYGGLLRGSYELTPGIRPFAEAGVDSRVHDITPGFGERRDSRGHVVRAGSSVEFSRLLAGELAVGYLTRTYDDPRLQELSGFLIDGSLVWTATGLTTVRLAAKSTVDETTLIGVSGIFRRDLGLQVDHAFRHWLVGTARFGYGLDTFPGSEREDQRYLASAALTYKLSRTVHVKGELRQEWLRSTFSGNDFTASTVLVGLRLMR